jgi:hypothetical protein
LNKQNNSNDADNNNNNNNIKSSSTTSRGSNGSNNRTSPTKSSKNNNTNDDDVVVENSNVVDNDKARSLPPPLDTVRPSLHSVNRLGWLVVQHAAMYCAGLLDNNPTDVTIKRDCFKALNDSKMGVRYELV